MNYYIQGNKEKADQIRAAFEKLGVASNANRYNYKNDSVLYFSAGGMVHMVDAFGSWANIIKTHPDYKELELPVEFKDGDIIGFNDCTHNDGSYIDWVGIYKEKADAEKSHFFHCVITSDRIFRVAGQWIVFTAYHATKEQRDLLFAKMKKAGYVWDVDKKELRKIKPHYDIKNFHAGMPVLVRDDKWKKWC